MVVLISINFFLVWGEGGVGDSVNLRNLDQKNMQGLKELSHICDSKLIPKSAKIGIILTIAKKSGDVQNFVACEKILSH